MYPQFVRDLISQDCHRGAYSLGEDAYTWEGLSYIPVEPPIIIPDNGPMWSMAAFLNAKNEVSAVVPHPLRSRPGWAVNTT